MIDHQLDIKIKEWIRKNKDAHLKQFLELIRIPSVLGDAADGAPFGKAAAAAVITNRALWQRSPQCV